MSRLIEELRIAHGDGSYIKFLTSLPKAALIVLDDWGLSALSAQDRADLLVWRDGAPTRDLYHWRLSSGQEVDFILEENGQLLPVEVKAATDVGAREARHVITFRERHANTPREVVLSADREIRAIRPGVIACPWWAVL